MVGCVLAVRCGMGVSQGWGLYVSWRWEIGGCGSVRGWFVQMSEDDGQDGEENAESSSGVSVEGYCIDVESIAL